jgi:hypothetical protein
MIGNDECVGFPMTGRARVLARREGVSDPEVQFGRTFAKIIGSVNYPAAAGRGRDIPPGSRASRHLRPLRAFPRPARQPFLALFG